METTSRKRLFVIEPDVTAHPNVKTQLAAGGFDCIFLSDPAKVLTTVDMKFEKDKPTAILVDIILPGTSGFEVSRKLSEHKLLVNIPIILTSKYRSIEDEHECLTAGACTVIDKPITADAVKKILEKVELRRQKNEAARSTFNINHT